MDFDGQVVRLERIKDLADRFVRVRLTRIDNEDLNLFAFDYDLTFMVFFLSPEGKVYARFGSRDAKNPDDRQSLRGLRYTMQSVLEMHQRKEREYAPRDEENPQYIRQLVGSRRSRGCIHCHNIKEVLNDDLKKTGHWSRELLWRYPLPDNLGLILELDRGNVVKKIEPRSAAAQAGLKPGDVVGQLNDVPVHSLADAQYALDRAPAKGRVSLAWKRDGQAQTGGISLPEGWRKSDISWRPSMQHWVPSLPLYGTDLTAAEKKTLELSPKQLAFRLGKQVHSRAQAAGIRPGDIILGVDGRSLEDMDVGDFHHFIRREYLVGDRLKVDVLREGKRLSLPLTLG